MINLHLYRTRMVGVKTIGVLLLLGSQHTIAHAHDNQTAVFDMCQRFDGFSF